MKIEGTLKSVEGHLREPMPMSADEFNAAQRAFYAKAHTFDGSIAIDAGRVPIATCAPHNLKIAQPGRVRLLVNKHRADSAYVEMNGPMPGRWARFWFRVLFNLHWEMVDDD